MIVTTKDGVSIEIDLYSELHKGDSDIIGKVFSNGEITGIIDHIKSCTGGVYLFTPSGYRVNALDAWQVCRYCFGRMRWERKTIYSWAYEPPVEVESFVCAECGRVENKACGHIIVDMSVIPF